MPPGSYDIHHGLVALDLSIVVNMEAVIFGLDLYLHPMDLMCHVAGNRDRKYHSVLNIGNINCSPILVRMIASDIYRPIPLTSLSSFVVK